MTQTRVVVTCQAVRRDSNQLQDYRVANMRGRVCSTDKLLLLFYFVLEFVLILTKQYDIECNNAANTLKWEKLTDFILEKEDNMSVILLAQHRQIL